MVFDGHPIAFDSFLAKVRRAADTHDALAYAHDAGQAAA